MQRNKRNTVTSNIVIFLILVLAGSTGVRAQNWHPAEGPLATRWAEKVSPDNVHPEYPRPQMAREEWQNLNGLWEYAIRPETAPASPAQYDGQILVPFSVTAALSGVRTQVGPQNKLWYRRTVRIPAGWSGQTVFLHFGAVDWKASVWVNGVQVGSHQGGYTPFTCDITNALTAKGPQEIVVSVWDPTDSGFQPRGKQVHNPHGIWYTPTTGIWQTVWMEPVPKTHIQSFRVTPDIDQQQVRIAVQTNQGAGSLQIRAEARDGNRSAGTGTGNAGESFVLSIPNPKLWSPDSPFLYDLKITLMDGNRAVDAVDSYFGMRKISVARDAAGTLRLCLNNKPLFEFGPLDQGFWPDGIYTAPTDDALKYDIQVIKDLGFNMIRKHVKIEPARWYYWADRLGVLVWQDMPSGDKYIGRDDPDIQRVAQSAHNYKQELKEAIDTFHNHPSIVMWVAFNEGWGQFDTGGITHWIKHYDPSRLVNSASGWADRGIGDVHDIHAYPGPAAPPEDPYRAIVLGEFGGLGLPLAGHTWQSRDNWGYRSYQNAEELTDAYLHLLEQLKSLIAERGLAAAVYTQTTDVEVEVNGLMTYDREIVKMDQSRVRKVNTSLYDLIK